MSKEIKNFQRFESDVLSNPNTFFLMYEAGADARRSAIKSEYIEWQKMGGKTKSIEFEEEDGGVISWKIGNEQFFQRINELDAPFTKNEYKNALSAVYSFMHDRPQYYKFRKLDGFFNPLYMLLNSLL